MNKSTLLRELITSPETLVMPDAYDPLSARLIVRRWLPGGSVFWLQLFPGGRLPL